MRKIIGIVLFAVGLIALSTDLWAYFVNAEVEATLIGDLWFDYSPATLNLLQAGLERHVWPPLWDPVTTTILLWPVSLVGIVLGALVHGVKSPA